MRNYQDNFTKTKPKCASFWANQFKSLSTAKKHTIGITKIMKDKKYKEEPNK